MVGHEADGLRQWRSICGGGRRGAVIHERKLHSIGGGAVSGSEHQARDGGWLVAIQTLCRARIAQSGADVNNSLQGTLMEAENTADGVLGRLLSVRRHSMRMIAGVAATGWLRWPQSCSADVLEACSLGNGDEGPNTSRRGEMATRTAPQTRHCANRAFCISEC